jgi:nitrite reductase/ring-hydroxylating ferredoxin subunit
MAWRTDAYLNAAGNRIVCASHGAEFEIETSR